MTPKHVRSDLILRQEETETLVTLLHSFQGTAYYEGCGSMNNKTRETGRCSWSCTGQYCVYVKDVTNERGRMGANVA